MTPPNTAAGLLAALRAAGCEPAADGESLALAADPPAALGKLLGVLHTGCRAVLAGKPWLGLTTGGRPVVLDPARPVPAGVLYLAASGDGAWDRVRPADRLDCPGLFDPPAPARCAA